MGGLGAPISQGGTNVSGGQRQRLSIARALVRRPDVYVFDDSFSSLDLATDARVRTALGPYTTGSAVLVVAQRVSTIMTANQILVLEDGRAVGLGTHQQLLERDVYKRQVLIHLLRTRLRPYRRGLLLLLVLQGIQALLNLYLPTLNAQIINKGVVTGNTHYIWSKGGEMLIVAFIQAGFAICAVYLGSRVAMGFGRDVRDALFHRSIQLSAREVNQLGAPSLITRVTNDVQQVQLLVVMSCTMVLAAPVTVVGGVILALNQDAGLSWLLGLSMPILAIALGIIIGFMVPQFRLMQERLDNVNRVLREQITGIRVVRAFVREHQEVGRFRVVNDELTRCV